MSHMVSARIPDAVYNQACIQLEEIGSTPTDLINAAFEYVLSEHKLPQQKQHPPMTKKRTLTKEQLVLLQKRLAACTPQEKKHVSSDIESDKKILMEARIKKYEALV